MKNKGLKDLIILGVAVVIGAILLRPQFAVLLNNKAMEYLEQGQPDIAIDLLQKALWLKNDPQIRAHLGKAYHKQGNDGMAIAEYQRAIELDPEYLGAYFDLASLHARINMFKESLSDLARARALDPQESDAELRKLRFEYAVSLSNDAIDLYKRGDAEGALAKLRESIAQSPNFVLPYGLLGDISLRRNLYKEAIGYYSKAAELGIKDPMVFNNMGICYMRLEDYVHGAACLKKAHEMAPSNVGILYGLAGTLRDNGQGEQALVLFRELVSRQYDYPGVHNDIAHLDEKLGQPEDAKKEFGIEAGLDQMKLEKNQNDDVSRTNLAIAYRGQEDYARAKAAVDQVLQRDPTNAEALYTRALIYEKMGLKNEALEDLERAKGYFLSNDFIDKDIRRIKSALP